MNDSPSRAGAGHFDDLLPDALREVIPRWLRDDGLCDLALRLHKHQRRRTFLDTLAEALIALHLQSLGCALRFEIPTPNGRTCDFEASLDGLRFYLNVKRIETDRPAQRRLTISSRLRVLEQIERSYVVAIRWREDATDEDMQQFVRDATGFVLRSRVGDELVVRSEAGREIGGVLIAAPTRSPHVQLAIGLPSGFTDEAVRFRRAMNRAYRQFMPRHENVIMLCSSHERDVEDFENALLGTHVERWDAYPPQDRRIAHGRGDDGFWYGRRHAASRAAGWFCLSPRAGDRTIHWLRRDEHGASRGGDSLDALFGGGVQIPA